MESGTGVALPQVWVLENFPFFQVSISCSTNKCHYVQLKLWVPVWVSSPSDIDSTSLPQLWSKQIHSHRVHAQRTSRTLACTCASWPRDVGARFTDFCSYSFCYPDYHFAVDCVKVILLKNPILFPVILRSSEMLQSVLYSLIYLPGHGTMPYSEMWATVCSDVRDTAIP